MIIAQCTFIAKLVLWPQYNQCCDIVYLSMTYDMKSYIVATLVYVYRSESLQVFTYIYAKRLLIPDHTITPHYYATL